MTINLVLADDQPLIRAGLSMVIADIPDIKILAEAGTGAEAVRLATHRPHLPDITRREREVLALVGRGMSNSEIAAHRFIGPATAKTHVARLLTELNARDRIQLVIIAHEAGLVSPTH